SPQQIAYVADPHPVRGTSLQTIGQIFSSRCPESRKIPNEHYSYEAYEKRFRLLLAEVPIKVQFDAITKVLLSTLAEEESIMDSQTAQDLKIVRSITSYSSQELEDAQRSNCLLPRASSDCRLADELDRTFTNVGKFFFDYRLANPINQA